MVPLMRRICRSGFALLTTTTLLLLLVPATGAQAATPPPPPVQSGPVVSPAVHMDVSPPLSRIIKAQEKQGKHEAHKPKPYHQPNSGRSASSGTPSSTTTLAIPATTLSFDGVGNGFSGPQGTFSVNAAPPDTNLAVGPSHVVEIVNTDFAIFNKSGSVLYGPVTINTLWSGFGGGCQANNDGDPIAKYDSIADRWVISQFSVATTPYLQCVAVSQTSDPTGAYNRYSFQYSNFPDYPKMSIWPDAYYITFNNFSGNTFTGGQACAYDRAKMLAGQAATQQCFNLGNSFGGLLPSDVDGSRLPPAGSPNYIVADGASANQIAYWRFHVDFTTSSNTTLTGPATLATAAFNAPCGGTGGTCVPQSGTSQQLDTLGDRLMYRLAYRNFGDHEALVVNRSITAGSGVGIRWYELRTGTGNSLNVFQQGTYAPDSSSRWMGSVAQDVSGDMGLGFSISSNSQHPGIHYTGRLAGDPAGTMSQGEATVLDGAGSQTANLSRWGDYSAMAVDPVDGCTFWFATEYIPANGTFNWKTRIATFKFPNCGTPPPTNDFSISASPASQSVNQGTGTSYTVSTATTVGTPQTVTLSASGLPQGAGATFNPTSVTSGGSSAMSVTTATSTPGGTYTITITGTGANTHSTTVSLVVIGPAGVTNGGFETGDFTGWTRTGTTSISTASHSGTYTAMVGGSSPTSGDSTVAQTFTAPNPTGPLTLWYKIVCPDTITYDWASATLVDNTASTTTTLLANTCSNTGAWAQTSPASITAGHSYTLKLLSHDDNYPSDPTYTLFDDVALAAPPTPDFTISATPASRTIAQGGSTTYAVTVTAQNGFAGTVSLSASGFGTDAGGSLSPTSVSGSGSSTLTVTTASTAATGSFPITINGASGSLSHNASVTLVVTPPADFSISATPGSQSVNQGNSTSYTVTVAALNGFSGTVALSATGFDSTASGSFNPASVAGGGTSTLTVTTITSATLGTFPITITGLSGSLIHSAGVSLVVNPKPASVIVNGGFETGDLGGWTPSGATSTSTTSHSGTYSTQVGSASPFNGNSSVSQTFIAPTGTGHTLSFWYRVVCTDGVTYDWATATLKDNTTNTTATVLARTCTNNGSWVHVTVSLTGGHSYTLTLIDRDDNYTTPPDPTYTLYDDIAVS